MMMKRKIFIILLCVVSVIMVFIGSKVYFEREAKIKISIIAGLCKNFVDFKYEKLFVNPFQQNITIKKVNLSSLFTNTKVYISEITVADFDYYSPMPKFADISIKGISVEPKDDPKDLKYKYFYAHRLFETTNGIDVDITYGYDEEKRLLSVKRLSIKESNLGKIDFRASLGNITLGTMEMLLLFFTYPSIAIHEASFYFENKLAMDLLYQYLGAVTFSTPSEMKLKLVENVDRLADQVSGEEPLDFFLKIKNFLEYPDKLLVTISPAPPITIRELQRRRFQQDFFKRLNLKAAG